MYPEDTPSMFLADELRTHSNTASQQQQQSSTCQLGVLGEGQTVKQPVSSTFEILAVSQREACDDGDYEE